MKKMMMLILVGTCAVSILAGCRNSKEVSNTSAKSSTESVTESSEVEKEEVKGIQADSAEDFMEKFFRAYYIDKTQDVSTIWDQCVAEKSKELNVMSEDDYVSQVKQVLFDKEFTDLMINSSSELQTDIYKVSMTYKYTNNGNESTGTEDWYIIKENENYKLLLSGILDVTEFGNTESGDSDFSLANLKVYTTAESIRLTYDFVNNSGQEIYMGPWAGTVKVTMTTDDGSQYTCAFDSMVKIAQNNSDSETLNYAGATGVPVQLDFDTITYVGGNGLPDGATSYTVTLN